MTDDINPSEISILPGKIRPLTTSTIWPVTENDPGSVFIVKLLF
jgi:hypothetical protein